MRYRLWFRDETNRPLTLIGHKQVSDSGVSHVWRDTTTLFTTLVEGHVEADEAATAKVIGSGILRIPVVSFAKQLTTLRGLGGNGFSRFGAVMKFGCHFMRTLWSIYIAAPPKSPPTAIRATPAAPVSPASDTDQPAPATTAMARCDAVANADVTRTDFTTADGLGLTLTRFLRKPTDDIVVLLHGLTTSTDMYIMGEHVNLTSYLLDHGYTDVWGFDWRGSNRHRYNEDENDYDFDDIAEFDLPAAIDVIRGIVGPDVRIHLIAHCIGSLSTMLSVAAGHIDGISSVIANSVALTPRVPRWSRVKLAVAPTLMERVVHVNHLKPDWCHRPWRGNFVGKLLSAGVAGAHRECDDPVCNMVSFMWGSGRPAAFLHENMHDATHARLGELFGPVGLSYFRHVNLMVKKGRAVSMKRRGRGARPRVDYLKRVGERPMPPVLFATGDSNRIFADSNIVCHGELSARDPGNENELVVFAGYGHQDVFMGKDCDRDVFPRFIQFSTNMVGASMIGSDDRPRFSILGSLACRDGAGENLKLGGAAQRRLLAILLLHANTVVPADRLRDLLELSSGGLRTAVSRLRGIVDSDTLISEPPGYLLRTDSLDALQFEQLVDSARTKRPEEAVLLFDQGLALFTGEPLLGFADEAWAQPSAVRLAELRASATEDRAEALLTLGRWSEVVVATETHAAEYPLRERPRGLLMRALAADGRQTEALRAYQSYRTLLVEEIGTEPSDDLRDLESKIATGWRDRARPTKGAVEPLEVGSTSGPVTFLFTDIEESTARWDLDPDKMVQALERHDRILTGAIEGHAGRVVKNTGDGLMAVFGEPVDALRAALDAQLTLGEVFDPAAGDIRVRMGAHSGVAMARGDDFHGRAVNRAARIMASAGGGQILCSAATAALARESLPGIVDLVEVGEQHLRGIAGLERIHTLRHPDLMPANVGPGHLVRGIRFGGRVATDEHGARWSAERVSDGEPLLVRVFGTTVVDRLDFARRFQLDAVVLVELDHPNIVRVVDAWSDSIAAYVVTEKASGLLLGEHVNATGRPDLDEAAVTARSLLATTAFAHERRIVHGNLSPSTVLVADDATVRLTGFAVGGVAASAAPYAAPEVRSSGSPGRSADIYALGALVHLILIGLEAPADLGTAEADGIAVGGSSRRRKVGEVIRRAMALRPVDRYSDVGDMLRDLDAALSEDGVAPPIDSGDDRHPLPVAVQQQPRFGFLGREAELATIEAAWHLSLEGQAQQVVLCGEPGIGKSALLAEAARRAHAADALVLHGRCFESAPVAYEPFAQAIRQLVEAQAGTDAEPDLDDHMETLSVLVPDLVGVRAVETAEVPSRLEQGIARFLAARSAQRPILLYLDDVQWADAASISVIERIQSWSGPSRLLIAMTVRDTENESAATDLVVRARREPTSTVLDVEGLASDTITGFLVAATSDSARFTNAHAWIIEQIHRETRGNPLFVTEVVAHLAETGVISSLARDWRPDERVTDLGIPRTVRDVVQRRLDSLPEVATELLPAAAVLGADIDPRLWQEVTVTGDDRFDEGLDELLKSGLIEELASPGGYEFSHAIVQSTIYGDLSRRKRARLHNAAAVALCEVDAKRLDEIAAHYSAGATVDHADRAVDYNQRAAEEALNRFAYRRAAQHLSATLELVTTGLVTMTDQENVDLLIELGEASRDAGASSFRATLVEAADRAIELGDGQRLVRAALANRLTGYSVIHRTDEERVRILRAALETDLTADPRSRALLLSRLALELTYVASLDERIRLAEESLSTVRQVDDSAAVAAVLSSHAAALSHPDTLDRRAATSEEARLLADELEDPMVALMATTWSVSSRFQLGDALRAEEGLTAFVERAEQVAQPAASWRSLRWQATDAAVAGDFGRSETLALESFRVGTSAGYPDALAYFGPQMFGIRFHQGRLGEMEETAEQGALSNISSYVAGLALLYAETGWMHKAEDTMLRLMAPELEDSLTTLLAPVTAATAMIAAHAVGDASSAERLYNVMLPWADQCICDSPYFWGSMRHHLALGAATMGDLEEAGDHFEAAVSIHEAMGSPPWTALSQVEWAQVLQRIGGEANEQHAALLVAQARSSARAFGLGAVQRRLDNLDRGV